MQQVSQERKAEVQEQIKDLTFMARCAHQADRYDDMTRFLYDVIELHEEISEDFTNTERYMLTVAYKNYIGPYQIGARVVYQIAKTPKYKKYNEQLIKYKREVADRLRDEAVRIARMFKEKAYKCASEQASMSFFNKCVGDYYRYAMEGTSMLMEERKVQDEERRQRYEEVIRDAENEAEKQGKDPAEAVAKLGITEDSLGNPDDGATYAELQADFEDIKGKALKAYSYAQHKAEKNLMSAHPIRLGVALNFSVFKWEYDDSDEAIVFAKKAVEVAMKKIESVKDDQDREDSNTIIDLLRENISQWEASKRKEPSNATPEKV